MNLFVYGTLLYQSVMDLVVEQKFNAMSARLPDYTRCCLRRRVYPGIVPHKNSHVDGLIYFDMSEQAIQRLDFFEGVEYDRIDVQPFLSNGESIQSCAYVVSPIYQNVLEVYKWNEDSFEQNHLDIYLKHVQRVMKNYQL